MRISAAVILGFTLTTAACGPSRSPRWAGSIDTLASGQVVVTNPAQPAWGPGEAWRVEEALRIGRVEGEGPDVFGRPDALAVDAGGRIWVLDGQAQDLRVFAPTGEYIRTVGRQGGGPGEFATAVRIDMGPDGNVWVMDPQNNRLSVFDTAGQYLEGRQVPGGFIILPWPGGVDEVGHYYAPVPRTDGGRFRFALVRYDASFAQEDTLELPRDPTPRESFELRSDGGGMTASVPFQGRLNWRLSPAGTIVALITDQYRLFEVGPHDDTLRTITRAFTPHPVTDADREQARENLTWFTDQGGKADWSKIPHTKPVVRSFFLDDEDDAWVEVVPAEGEPGAVWDVFGPEGRYLGVVRMPFRLALAPVPVIRDRVLYGVVRDELDVPYVVVARITKP